MSSKPHDATGTALGFRYQERYALLELFGLNDDEACVSVETLDDIHLQVGGADLLEQLKHSIQAKPAPISEYSPKVWKTLAIWCDLILSPDLKASKLILVTVAPLASDTKLKALAENNSDRTNVVNTLLQEAKRVVDDYDDAKALGNSLPHKDRIAGARAFLSLTEKQRLNLIERITLKPGSPTVGEVEKVLSNALTTYPPKQRDILAARTCEWWDRQILQAMCDQRPRYIKRHEVLEQLSEISSSPTSESLMDSFGSKMPPEVYTAHDILNKQCSLVNAPASLMRMARITEWQARNQRSRWATEAPSKIAKITDFDDRLVIEWSYQHTPICEPELIGDENQMSDNGLDVLKWAMNDAPGQIGSIENTITSPFYIRGSFQVLSIEGRVGWHPEYMSRIGFK
jgi:hypothetical protein